VNAVTKSNVCQINFNKWIKTKLEWLKVTIMCLLNGFDTITCISLKSQNFNNDILQLSNIAIGGAQVPISILGESFR